MVEPKSRRFTLFVHENVSSYMFTFLFNTENPNIAKDQRLNLHSKLKEMTSPKSFTCQRNEQGRMVVIKGRSFFLDINMNMSILST